MSLRKFVPSNALIATALVAVVLLAGVLLATGFLNPFVGDPKSAIRIVRALLLLAAMFCSAASFLMLLGAYRDSAPLNGKWLSLSSTGALSCLLAVWVLSNMLR